MFKFESIKKTIIVFISYTVINICIHSYDKDVSIDSDT